MFREMTCSPGAECRVWQWFDSRPGKTCRKESTPTVRNTTQITNAAWRDTRMYDRDDKRLFVPRKSGLGTTLNFAHPLAWVVIVAIVGLIVASRYLR